MHSGNDFTTLFSYGVGLGSFFHRVPFALCFGKRFLLFSKESLVGYCLSVTGDSKGIETHVNANGRASVCFLTYVAYIARDSSEPLARRRARDGARLRNAVKWPVLDNANTAYFTHSQALIVQSASIGKLRIGDRIIAILTLVSGKASFLARLCTLFETTKECFECPIYSCGHLLQYLTIYLLECKMLLLQQWYCFGLFITRQTFFILLPCLDSRTDKLVI